MAGWLGRLMDLLPVDLGLIPPAIGSNWAWLLVSAGVLVLVVAARRHLRSLMVGGRWSLVAPLGLVAIFAFFGLRATTTGDEPHYLIMAESLLNDGDFDLRNNYRQMDYLAYYPGELPDSHVIVIGERWYPVHGIGLPVLAAPWFALGGRPLVVIALAFASVLGVAMVWSFLRRIGFHPSSAGIAAAAVALTLPLAPLSAQIYPEVPAFLLAALALRSMAARTMTGMDLLAFTVAVAVLPWLHPKFLLVDAVLLGSAVALHQGPGAIRRMAIPGAAAIAAAAGLFLLSYSWYGVPLPANVLPRFPAGEDPTVPLFGHFFSDSLAGFAGLLFDQQSGLFTPSPVLVLAVPGMLLMVRRARSWAMVAVALFLSVYMPAGAWGVWHADGSSPARFLVPALPAVAFGIAGVADSTAMLGRRVIGMLALPSILHAYLMLSFPGTRYGDPETHHNYFLAFAERSAHVDLTLLFPSFRSPTAATWVTLLFYVAAVVTLTVVLFRGRARPVGPGANAPGPR